MPTISEEGFEAFPHLFNKPDVAGSAMLGLVPRRIIRREVGEDDVCSGAANGPKDLQHASLGVEEAGCRTRLDERTPLTL